MATVYFLELRKSKEDKFTLPDDLVELISVFKGYAVIAGEAMMLLDYLEIWFREYNDKMPEGDSFEVRRLDGQKPGDAPYLDVSLSGGLFQFQIGFQYAEADKQHAARGLYRLFGYVVKEGSIFQIENMDLHFGKNFSRPHTISEAKQKLDALQKTYSKNQLWERTPLTTDHKTKITRLLAPGERGNGEELKLFKGDAGNVVFGYDRAGISPDGKPTYIPIP